MHAEINLIFISIKSTAKIYQYATYPASKPRNYLQYSDLLHLLTSYDHIIFLKS